MTIFEWLTIFLSLLALIVSAITAYQTFFVKFKSEIWLRPRLILAQINGKPVIIIGCELFNQGTKFGSIDDSLLTIKYRQENPRIIEKYIFFPILTRDNYNIYHIYQERDFEAFQSISIAPKSRLLKYIVFSSANKNFDPAVGQAEIKLYFRNFGETKWRPSRNQASLDIKQEAIANWRDPQGESIIVETNDNNKNREKFLERVFR